MGQSTPTTTNYDSEEAEWFDDSEQLHHFNIPEKLPMNRRVM